MVVNKSTAKTCEKCVCEAILTECVFGPDSRGDFQHLNVTLDTAERCDRDNCICSSHGSNYVELAVERRAVAHNKVAKAMDEAQIKENTRLGIVVKE